jgi:hypothetical protein
MGQEIIIPDGHAIAVSYGGGVDSTAMLIALYRAGIKPDIITFADVGGEKPETITYVKKMDEWLLSVGFPKITWCRKIPLSSTGYKDLEGNCLSNETLPSLAFGMKSCSIKWKHTPQDYALKGCKSGPMKCDPHSTWIDSQKTSRKIVKLIGYDNGKADLRRSKNLKHEDKDFIFVYPLQQLGWDRKKCIEAITEEGFAVPIKSACFFCPASKIWELYWLAAEHPDLMERALKMEMVAMTGHHTRFSSIEMGAGFLEMIGYGSKWPSSKTTVGLGRSFAWNHFARINKIVDSKGRVIREKKKYFLEISKKLQNGGGNANDQRTNKEKTCSKKQ